MDNLLIYGVVACLLFLIIYFRYYSPIIVTYKVSPDVKKLVKAPQKSYHKAACWDVFSVEDISIPIGQWREIRTGITFAPWPHIFLKWFNVTLTPFGNVAMKVHTRSGLARRKGIRCHLGIIDNDYRGELTILVFNHRTDYPVRFKVGDKIAQIEFYRVLSSFMIKVNKLTPSLRGGRGFGSTG
ncbi:MAG: hypothetical protein M0R03_10935 [Novosphingobium sp.]|nr:hypothetical protein [Novosphingobium sp.]